LSEAKAGFPSDSELRAGFTKMSRLAWITLFYQIGAAALIGFFMGSSLRPTSAS
jgi:hypothetical protein